MSRSDGGPDDGLGCSACGGELEFLEQVGATAFYRCRGCGKKQAFHVVPDPEELYRALGPRGRLKVSWKNQEPRARDALALRQLVQEFKELSVGDVLARIRGHGEWVFDGLTSGMAEELKERALALGLCVVVEFPD